MSDAATPLVRATTVPPELARHWVPLATPMLPGYVLRVVDGDTVEALVRTPLWDYPARPTIRLALVDAPESQQPRSPAEAALAAKATAFAVSVLAGKQVAVVPAKTYKDDRNRWVCRLLYRDARGNACDYGEALTKRRLTKADVAAFSVVLESGDAAAILAWGSQ